MHKIVNVNKKMGLSVVMLHYPTFPDFKDLRAVLLESEAKLEMKIFNPSSFFVWR